MHSSVPLLPKPTREELCSTQHRKKNKIPLAEIQSMFKDAKTTGIERLEIICIFLFSLCACLLFFGLTINEK